MIDHLICDCDGVLVDSEIIADRVMLETLSATFPGLDFEPVVKTAFGQQTSRFLEGIEMTERRLGWSARSGKIVLRLALMRLERHYVERYGSGSPLIDRWAIARTWEVSICS
mgnify:CR=1 FL=1